MIMTKDMQLSSSMKKQDPVCLSGRRNEVEVNDAGKSSVKITQDDDTITYPETGARAWLCVFGSFMALTGCLGLVNSVGIFQAYIQTHQLASYDSGTTGWIFSTFVFFTFFCGIQVGPIFDANGPHLLMITGSMLFIAAMVSLGFCTAYWHFMLCFGIAAGIGASLVFNPAIAAVGHHFRRRRALSTGIAAGGGSCGGVIFPIFLVKVFPRIGFAWATRAMALMCLVCFAIGCIFVTSRLPTKPFTRKNILPDFRIFKDSKFLLTTMAVFFIEWGLFIPLTYIVSYALSYGHSEQFSYQLLTVINAGSFFGRLAPGYIADKIGRFNTFIITIIFSLLCNACLWLPANGHTAILIAYCCLFGIASGSNISLTPVCIGQLCHTEHYGRYFATAYLVVSLGVLTGVPIAGEILARCNGDFWGLIAFTTCCYAAGLICAAAVKVLQCGWRDPRAVF